MGDVADLHVQWKREWWAWAMASPISCGTSALMTVSSFLRCKRHVKRVLPRFGTQKDVTSSSKHRWFTFSTGTGIQSRWLYSQSE